MSLLILFHFLCAQHVSDINISIIRSLRLCCWITTSASACNTDTTQIQPHQISNTQRTENKTTDVVIQQHSRKLLMTDILMSETCWAHKKWNKRASDVKLVFYSSAIAMMHGSINIIFTNRPIYRFQWTHLSLRNMSFSLTLLMFDWLAVSAFSQLIIKQPDNSWWNQPFCSVRAATDFQFKPHKTYQNSENMTELEVVVMEPARIETTLPQEQIFDNSRRSTERHNWTTIVWGKVS